MIYLGNVGLMRSKRNFTFYGPELLISIKR